MHNSLLILRSLTLLTFHRVLIKKGILGGDKAVTSIVNNPGFCDVIFERPLNGISKQSSSVQFYFLKNFCLSFFFVLGYINGLGELCFNYYLNKTAIKQQYP